MSYVSNFIILVGSYMDRYTSPSPKDTSGSNASTSMPLEKMDAAANVDTFGILIGSDNTAVGVLDYFLGSQHVDSAFDHGVTTIDSLNLATDPMTFRVTRSFVNVSGGNLTVEECCMVLYNSSYSDYVMIARDLTGSQVKADGTTITITYTLEVTLPWTKNFIRGLKRGFDNDSSQTFVDTDGDTITISTQAACMNTRALADVTDTGLLIGDSNSAVTLSDNSISQLVTNWRHYAQTKCGQSNVADAGTGVSSFMVYRQFKNETGSSDVVEEVGLVAEGSGSSGRILLARWLTGGITVANNESIVIYMTPQVDTDL